MTSGAFPQLFDEGSSPFARLSGSARSVAQRRGPWSDWVAPVDEVPTLRTVGSHAPACDLTGHVSTAIVST